MYRIHCSFEFFPYLVVCFLMVKELCSTHTHAETTMRHRCPAQSRFPRVRSPLRTFTGQFCSHPKGGTKWWGSFPGHACMSGQRVLKCCAVAKRDLAVAVSSGLNDPTLKGEMLCARRLFILWLGKLLGCAEKDRRGILFILQWSNCVSSRSPVLRRALPAS